jgi:hypothetical protein
MPEIFSSQQDNPTFKEILLKVKGDVEAGSTFADALRKHPRVFNDLFCNLAAAGEAGGILDTILNRLASYIEKAMNLKKKVKGAMVYPAVVFFIALIVVSALLIFVIRFPKCFADMGEPSSRFHPTGHQLERIRAPLFPRYGGDSRCFCLCFQALLPDGSGSSPGDDYILRVPVLEISLKSGHRQVHLHIEHDAFQRRSHHGRAEIVAYFRIRPLRKPFYRPKPASGKGRPYC